MAQIFPFRAYRYTPKAGPLHDLLTQPYDKITSAMQARYLSLSPHNLVRVILGERQPSDAENDNVYTRAAQYLKEWIAQGILSRDPAPGLFAYFQEFCVPDSGEKLVRKGFIGLGAVPDYSAGVVYRHEQTLSGPKKDRLELLRHTHAHFEQLFMLYSDPAGEIDRLLDEADQAPPIAVVADENGAEHRLWRISEPGCIEHICQFMSHKKLLIADGHHRYETALAFRHENPGLRGADKVIMTFVSMDSPGLKILATHRLVSGLTDFNEARFLAKASSRFRVQQVDSAAALQQAMAPRRAIGAAIGGHVYLLEPLDGSEKLDVEVLHGVILGQLLDIDEQAVREEKNLRYVRGQDAAIEEARKGAAQIAFLLRPTSIQQVAEISFAGHVMPQKSTDFYPKLLSGLTIYKFD